MKKLFFALAFCLCALCAWQWYGQMLQRRQIENQNQSLYENAVTIQGFTNSIMTMDRQIAHMDEQITDLKATVKTNQQVMLTQKREIDKLKFDGQVLTNQLAQYKTAVTNLEGKLKDAYEGIKKQNDAVKELTAQRDGFVNKLNESVKDRNNIVSNYNELAKQMEKLELERKK